MSDFLRPACRTLVALLTLAAAGPAAAEGSFAIGLKAGTPGLGLEATARVTDRLNLRAGYYGFNYSTEIDDGEITYEGDLRLSTFGVLGDWHPYGGSFRITAGLFHNGNEFKGSAEGDLEVGDDTYDVRLDATIDWRSMAPYLGMGYGNPLQGGRWRFSADAGVMFTGSPDVRLKASGDGTNDPGFEENRRREERNLKDEVKDFRFYPVVSVGVSYRF
ncbi:hypothetical protein B1C78_08600 [Thioalkalivibrio denitrificans]|uniref:Outer membrane protein beta-barrel domain-containing protein n=1 Tax=Thioalkalivibrio denitrificans TaxID=108003 RepID=A0A1V3NI77_9GAMM|nr:hypothetical protein [Thioalkalivibrio denitrificans]OOG24552.1 hypothetical protein B1C78_08600 [Thioalkalivibrio denitrificans]